MLLTQDVKTTRVLNSASAGQTTLTGDAVECRDFRTVAFYVEIGSITGGGSVTIKAQGSNESGSGFADLDGASITVDDTNADTVAVLEISQPRHLYVQPVIERADQDSAINGVIALQAQAETKPVTHDAASVAGHALVLAPDTV